MLFLENDVRYLVARLSKYNWLVYDSIMRASKGAPNYLGQPIVSKGIGSESEAREIASKLEEEYRIRKPKRLDKNNDNYLDSWLMY